jgi:GT2 family glycosyltransferase
MSNRCDIIIPVWNQLDVTRACVDSIVSHTAYPHRLIVIDNASGDETADYLDSLKLDKRLDMLLIRNARNLGFVRAVNQGIGSSDAPYLCIMNNDTVATDGWLDEMVRVMESDPGLGLVNPSSNTSGQFPGNMTVDEYARTLAPLAGKVQELYTCRGFCMLVKREVIDRVGLLDEIYHIGYFDDTDYCKRAQRLGYRTARAKASYVYHKENISFKNLANNSELFEANKRIFYERWGRHVRVGYLVDRVRSRDLMDDIAVSTARRGHQIIFFIRDGLDWPVGLDHFDIRRYPVNGALFGPISIYKIFKRRAKKPIEIVLTDSALLGAVLRATARLHGADVLVSPAKEALMELLEKRSKQIDV